MSPLNSLAEPAVFPKARLLIVDDHPIVREGLKLLLAAEPDLEVAWQAANSKEALNVCEVVLPDLAIVDLMLGKESGMDLISVLHKRYPSLPILTLSLHDESRYAQEAFQAGARGYVTKGLASKNIAEAIREVLGGQVYVRVSQSTAPRPGPMPASSLRHRLTERELEVLELIGNRRSKSDMAIRLGVSINTVETYRMRMKKKLQLESNDDLVELARELFKSSS